MNKRSRGPIVSNRAAGVTWYHRIMQRILFASIVIGLAVCAIASAEQVNVGVAKVDVTPDYPVRLNGFGFRRVESEGVTQKIWAKAIAFDHGGGAPAVLVTVDSLGVPDWLTRQVAERLSQKAMLDPARFVVTFTHSHTTPMLKGTCPTIFGTPIPPQHMANIERYTAQMADWLEEVSLAALKDRKPATLGWAVGRVGFAANRRTPGGPVDHDLPMLVVRSPDGAVRAIYVSYACHCVTLSHNHVSGDWAGYAAEAIEQAYPGAVGLVSIGAGADANPSSGVTGDKTDIAAGQGRQIADEVKRLLTMPLTPVGGRMTAALNRIDLPLREPFTKQQWQQRAEQGGAVAHHAKAQLERLDRGESLRTHIEYPVQTWAFGDDLAMVFLAGEVVVDYAHRLKRELDGERVWVHGYSNDFPFYIPSERVLTEGGYEGGDSMIYFDVPSKFAPGLEQKIIDEVRRQVPDTFDTPKDDAARTDGSRPLSPLGSMRRIRVREGFTVELVAAEPMVADPVAIDFGPDGRLWVAEMIDYPSGMDGHGSPGGRIRVLTDADGDGRYDKATVFADQVPFPTGVTVWRKGVIVCAAPEVIYMEDTDGDGAADVRRVLLSGFATHNFQGRVNSLRWGLDNRMYAAAGLFGGVIRGTAAGGDEVDLNNRDFRFHPDTGLLEPAAGQTQQSRVRNDYGDWFGCDSGTLIRQYPLHDHYVKRNPFAAPPPPASMRFDGPNPHRMFPIHAGLQLFALSGAAGGVTAACGVDIYRDELLGEAFAGDAFTCEPVNLVVHRKRLARGANDVVWTARRAEDEAEREFLASTDNWFRPVQVRTGPDGALWVVDMYRYVIEHPRWIPPDRVAQLDMRAGEGLGRIYRVYPTNRPPRAAPRLDRLDGPALAGALDTPNGTMRDLAHQMLLWREGTAKDAAVIDTLESLARRSDRPAVRLQAMGVLDGLNALRPAVILAALDDAHPAVRRHAVRLCEGRLEQDDSLGESLLRRLDDDDATVRLQLACTLGEWGDKRAGEALGRLLLRDGDDPYLSGAAMSSVLPHLERIVETVLSAESDRAASIAPGLTAVAVASGNDGAMTRLIERLAAAAPGPSSYQAVGSMLDVLQSRSTSLRAVHADAHPSLKATIERLDGLFAAARSTALDGSAEASQRAAAAALLGRGRDRHEEDFERLKALLSPRTAPPVQLAAVAAMGRLTGEQVPAALLANWAGHSPSLRGAMLDVLLSREAWTIALLDAAKRDAAVLASLDPARREVLRNHGVEAIRQQAAALGEAVSRDRQAVIDRYAAAIAALETPADAARGRAVFAQVCAVCHRLEGVGQPIGPDLAALTDRSSQAMLIAVLDPNRAVLDQYTTYVLTTTDGRAFAGVIAAETAASITIRSLDGASHDVLRIDVQSQTSTGRSLMPDGLEQTLDARQMADLLAYLNTSPAPLKRYPGNEPALVRPDADGSLGLLATVCEIYGDEINYEHPPRALGYWHGERDKAVWSIELTEAGEYDVELEYSCDNGVAGNRFIVEGGAEPIRGVVAGTNGWAIFNKVAIGRVSLPAGPSRVTFRSDGPIRGALLDLRALRLTPRK